MRGSSAEERLIVNPVVGGSIPSLAATQHCAACKGAAHPATGCQYSERVLTCRACTVRFWAWLRRIQGGKARGGCISFYDHVRPA